MSWREEENNSDCNLSEVNYRSVPIGGPNREIQDSTMADGATSKLGMVPVKQEHVDWTIVEENGGASQGDSPEPKRYRDSNLQYQVSGTKLIKGDDEMLKDSYKPTTKGMDL